MNIHGGLFDFGSAQLAVGNGGTGVVNQTSGVVTGKFVVLGFEAGGHGTYELGGDGRLSVGDHITVGRGGEGVFRQTGGQASTGFLVYVGLTADGTYEMLNGHLQTKEVLVGEGVGISGSFVQRGGLVEITGYSPLIENGLILGYRTMASSGAYEMHGGLLLVEKTALIGRYGQAQFTQTEGTCAFREVILGAYAQDDSDFAVGRYQQSGGYCWVGGNLYVGLAGAVGEYELSGGDNIIRGYLSLGTRHKGTGTYTVAGGVLEVDGSVRNAEDGTGCFKVVGSRASITIGPYEQGEGGKLISEIDASGLSTIQVNGPATLGGTWEVLDKGAEFGRSEVLRADGGLSGTFDSVVLPGPDWRWGIDSGVTLWVEYVPEPATLALLATGGLALLRRRRGLGG